MNENEPVLQITNLIKRFPINSGARSIFSLRRERMTVLQQVTFSVERGEIFSVVGANGAGKSTLLRIIATLLLSDGGNVLLKGIDVRHDPISARRMIGFLGGGEGGFYPRLSGRDNLIFFARILGASKGRVEGLLSLTRLSSDADRLVKDYSVGMRRRLDFARALLNDPPVLLLDEPTRSLDPHAKGEIHAFLKDELVSKQKKTVLLVSHDIDEVKTLSRRCLRLEKGCVAGIGSSQTVLEGWR